MPKRVMGERQKQIRREGATIVGDKEKTGM